MINHKKLAEQKKVSSGTLKSRLDAVEKQLLKLGRRGSSYVIGIAPKIPIMEFMNEPDAEGVIFRKLIPADSIVSTGYLYLQQLNTKTNAQLLISVTALDGSVNEIKLPLNKNMNMLSPNATITAGQRITLAVNPVDCCSGIWVGLVLEMLGKGLTEDKTTTDQFLKLIEKADEELLNV